MRKNGINHTCPVCGGNKSSIIFKNEQFILYSCRRCRSNFQDRLKDIDKPYDEKYFSDNHVRAYGTSYIGDEENIRSISRRRLENIKKLLPSGKTLLDVGSAMGIFCSEAIKAGLESKGAEISEYAREYTRSRFNIDCYPDFMDIEEKFDCVTLWFTLEHIENPGLWIQKCHSLLNNGGLICIAIPNGRGAFALFNPGDYFKARPVEHYFEPSLKGLKILFKKSGFKIEKFEYFGLHPERIKFLGKPLPQLKILQNLQKILRSGDTLEVYAEKINAFYKDH